MPAPPPNRLDAWAKDIISKIEYKMRGGINSYLDGKPMPKGYDNVWKFYPTKMEESKDYLIEKELDNVREEGIRDALRKKLQQSFPDRSRIEDIVDEEKIKRMDRAAQLEMRQQAEAERRNPQLRIDRENKQRIAQQELEAQQKARQQAIQDRLRQQEQNRLREEEELKRIAEIDSGRTQQSVQPKQTPNVNFTPRQGGMPPRREEPKPDDKNDKDKKPPSPPPPSNPTAPAPVVSSGRKWNSVAGYRAGRDDDNERVSQQQQFDNFWKAKSQMLGLEGAETPEQALAGLGVVGAGAAAALAPEAAAAATPAIMKFFEGAVGKAFLQGLMSSPK